MSKQKNTKQSGGILSGLLLLVIGIGILWYNEGRTVKTQSTINEAKQKYTDVSSEKIDKKYEGKLIATKGKLDLSETELLKDDKFGITVTAAKMKRVVEMYQWEESCETNEDDTKTCTYEKVWSSKLIDSKEFTKSGHDNPTTMPYESEEQIASNVKLGAFTVPEELLKSLSYNNKKSNEDLTKEYQNNIEGLTINNSYLTNVKENTEEIGDIRISFEYLSEETVSIMAVQTGNTFEAFTSKTGKDVYKILKGNHTGAQILEGMTKTNKTIKWLLRFVGIIIIISGFNSMFTFITNLTSKIPILGNLVSGATGLISALLGTALSLIIIAIAWFRFRPILSIVLIIIVAAIMIIIKTKVIDKIKNKKD